MHILLGGLIAGIVLAGGIHALFQGRTSIPDDWETLTVGIIALMSYMLHRDQIRQDKEHRKMAALAGNADDLSDVVRYADNAMSFALRIYDYLKEEEALEESRGHILLEEDIKKRNERITTNKSKKDAFLSEASPSLSKDLLHRIGETAGALSEQRYINLLNSYQVQNSRLKGLVNRVEKPTIRNTTLIATKWGALNAAKDAARIRVLASKLLDIPRPPGWEFENDDVSDVEIKSTLSHYAHFDLTDEKGE